MDAVFRGQAPRKTALNQFPAPGGGVRGGGCQEQTDVFDSLTAG